MTTTIALAEAAIHLQELFARAAAGEEIVTPHRRDPFDRMLVAQAQIEGLMLVIHAPEIARYEVARLDA